MHPLKDLLVIELGTVLAIPAVGTFFAELGAKVIKIEPPSGDVTRTWKNSQEDPTQPASAYFASVNYGKELKKFNLKDADDLQAVKELCFEADVVLSNFKTGDDLRFGLDYDTLKLKNPKLIYAHLFGFRSDPDRLAYDTILQAETGFMFMNGYPDSPPSKMPVALIDILGGHQLKEGILLALLQREKDGLGTKVEVTLEESALASLANQASNYLTSNLVPQRAGTLHPNIAPYGEMFQTKDGQLIVLAVGNNRQFSNLCEVLGMSDVSNRSAFISNSQRVQNREALHQILAPAFEARHSTDLMTAFHKRKVPAGVVMDMRHIFSKNPTARDLVLKEKIDGSDTQRVRSAVFRLIR